MGPWVSHPSLSTPRTRPDGSESREQKCIHSHPWGLRAGGKGSPPIEEHGGSRREPTETWDWESEQLNPVTTTARQAASASDLSSLCLSGSISLDVVRGLPPRGHGMSWGQGSEALSKWRHRESPGQRSSIGLCGAPSVG